MRSIETAPRFAPPFAGEAVDGVDEVAIAVSTNDESAEILVVYGPLDRESYRVYLRLRDGFDRRGGSQKQATRYLVRKFRRVEGLDLDEEIARWGSEHGWFHLSDEGWWLADATVPVYVERSVPSSEECDLIAKAARVVAEYSDKKDSFDYTEHANGCDRDIWEDTESDLLVSARELAERECPSCSYQRRMWKDILKKTGSSRYGNLAQAGFDLRLQLELVPGSAGPLSVWEYECLRIAQSEVTKREVQKARQTKDDQSE
jgi:hypothetical protein